MKRLFDVLVSGTAIVVLSPLLVVISLFIYLQDRGPIFFKQQRFGLGGKLFYIMKFRTMIVGAEKKRFLLHQR